MDDMIEDAVQAAGGEMDDMPGDEEEFMPVNSTSGPYQASCVGCSVRVE
jgi:hypothetical protein